MLIGNFGIDSEIDGTEKLLGTNSTTDGSVTANYSIQNLKAYFQDNLNFEPSQGPLTTTVVTVTASEMKALTDETPITLIAAPGAGKALDIHQVILYRVDGVQDHNFTQYAYFDTGFSTFGDSHRLHINFINASWDPLLKVGLGWDGSHGLKSNETFQLKTLASSATTNGDSTFYMEITYKTVIVSPTFK
jgi:hypothetical protein